MNDPYSIIERPILTEKSMAGAAHGKYTFRVNIKANKIEVREAIEKLFPGKRVLKVNTLIMKGETVRRPNRPPSKRSSWKKAIVTLAPGQTLDLFEGV